VSANGRDTLYRVNSGDVVHETIEGEVIAIDLARGSYYNLAGSGPRIWSQLIEGASVASIASGFESSEDVEQEVAALIDRLAQEALIVEQPDAAASGSPAQAEPVPFEPARFEKYTDMEDYFLLDPIHEVDASGWPNRPPA
jgi:coenzyme PQQ synthesis protein D (PqqD)